MTFSKTLLRNKVASVQQIYQGSTKLLEYIMNYHRIDLYAVMNWSFLVREST